MGEFEVGCTAPGCGLAVGIGFDGVAPAPDKQKGIPPPIDPEPKLGFPKEFAEPESPDKQMEDPVNPRGPPGIC